MRIIATVLTILVALIHMYIVYFEMFAWETVGKRVFKTFPEDLFKSTKALAANQGLYNAFLVIGLIWSFFINEPYWTDAVAIFFLGCVVMAGIFGSLTASKRIFFVQSMPAILAIICIVVSRYL